MPNFRVTIASGTTLEVWTDPPGAAPYCSGTAPSRTNPGVAHPALYPQATVGTPVVFAAVVAGVTGPADAALGGELFLAWLAESPAPTPPVTRPAGFSSAPQFTPQAQGHYCFVMQRPNGGAVAIHLDAVL